ncbi:S8 family serine peptidase [Microbispora sp. NBRC 16548]|uniref:S8 family peptidase n=1 Tax=Microbispora sp. NBRC 16548 TaxID=3030994 RepID=UPI0024A154B0|nr:S8 family serine peptidase [Microbispora sp. NBRC 16548]GLX07037.1 serine protease [Microbispora sp. NBRC 16548]
MYARGRLAGAIMSITMLGGLGVAALPGAAAAAEPAQNYLVFYKDGGSAAAQRAAEAAGGTVQGRDDKLGYLVVRASDPEKIGADPSVVGVTLDRPIGKTAGAPATSGASVSAGTRRTEHVRSAPGGDPLSGRQWDMKMIGATPTGSYAKARGSRKVLVGVIDTGVDGTHPDIAPNFNRALSRNFVVDQPTDENGKTLDGPCEHTGCKDPADVDDDGHGTHVASTIGSPINGLGVSGVAPDVSLVNLRAGTDSGFFFLKPTMDALEYAADVGVDVVNMSFYVDPWTFNCENNPSDTNRERLEQRAILEGMRRAVKYARAHGVTLVSAIGNEGLDLGKVKSDTSSPDFPKGAEKKRVVDNTCINVPAELDGVISVSSVGPGGRKASYSDYGVEQTDIAAPGGDMFDGGTDFKGASREILAAAPENVLRAKGLIDAAGKPKTSSVIRDCHDGKCAYYQYMEGTSMAAPHVTGVAALIIGRFGKPGKGGLQMDPAQVERLLYAAATPKGCPAPRTYRYGTGESQLCEGPTAKNGFFGHGLVDAARAATVAP